MESNVFAQSLTPMVDNLVQHRGGEYCQAGGGRLMHKHETFFMALWEETAGQSG